MNCSTPTLDGTEAFALYESVRARLPKAGLGGAAAAAPDLGAVAADFDLILLDAFGVLNVGETAIAGAVERVDSLRAAGKRVMLVTNSAGYPKRALLARYDRMRFGFSPEDVVSSREAVLDAVRGRPPLRWGVMAEPAHGREELTDLDAAFLLDDPAVYDAAEGFILLGSGGWTGARQEMLATSLRRTPRPVLVGNPDIVAPREAGFTREPGFYAHRLADIPGVAPEFFGKPFGAVFRMALARCGDAVAPDRVLMVGDTLHTDVLGGQAAGFRTALVTDFGSLKDADISAAIAASGISPDWVAPHI